MKRKRDDREDRGSPIGKGVACCWLVGMLGLSPLTAQEAGKVPLIVPAEQSLPASPDGTKRVIPPPPIPVTKDSPNSENPDPEKPGPKTPAPVISDPAPTAPPPPVPRLNLQGQPVSEPVAAKPAPVTGPVGTPKKTEVANPAPAVVPRPPAPVSTVAPPERPVAPVSVSAPKPAAARVSEPKPEAPASKGTPVPAKNPLPAKKSGRTAGESDKSPLSSAEDGGSPGLIGTLLAKLKWADRGVRTAATKGTEKPAKVAAKALPATQAVAGGHAAVGSSAGAFLYRFREGGMIQMRLAAGEVLEILGGAPGGERRQVRTIRGAEGYVKSAEIRAASAAEVKKFVVGAGLQ